MEQCFWAPQALLGRRVTPARPYERYYTGQSSGVGSATLALFPHSGHLLSFLLCEHQHIPPRASIDTGATIEEGMTLLPTHCSQVPERDHRGALMKDHLALQPHPLGYTYHFLRLGCLGKLPSISPREEIKATLSLGPRVGLFSTPGDH